MATGKYLKIRKIIKIETFKYFAIGIMMNIPFDENGFNVNKDFTINFTINFEENEKKVISLIKTNSEITTNELSEKLNISRRVIQIIINPLKEKNVLTREGSRKIGYWKIVASNKDD